MVLTDHFLVATRRPGAEFEQQVGDETMLNIRDLRLTYVGKKTDATVEARYTDVVQPAESILPLRRLN